MNKELPAGSTLSHYRIVSKIGAGGMGEVYLAQDTKLDRKVAIKFLHEEFSKDADKLARFIQEAKAASALNHPNILTVYEIGEVDGKNYIATELIEGQTLREHLSHKESLQLNQILKIGVQVAEALSAAHQAGIIHRDIKPENIMLRKDGYAKVLDFGLAKLSEPVATGSAGSEDATRVQVNTTPGMVMGTVSYMSPEQARGKETDARTDIWSLGVVLYEMLAGKVPFTGETINHTIVSILEKEPLLLEKVPGELQRIVRKSMTKDVDMRYQSARDLLIDLKNLRRDLDIQGELERSIIPNREAATGAIRESETRMYASGAAAVTRSGQIPATQNVSSSSSSLEYAVNQAKSHKRSRKNRTGGSVPPCHALCRTGGQR
jgi:serine/threonine protein kinase